MWDSAFKLRTGQSYSTKEKSLDVVVILECVLHRPIVLRLLSK
jgi:hypothetical protein